MEAAAVNMEYLVKGVWTALSDEEEPVQTEFIVNSDENCRPVCGDRHLLYQLFENLMRNAIKYTAGYGCITVDISPDGEYTAVSVTDTGIGISEEEIPYLFTPFFRGTRSDVKGKEGTGLGLVIAKAITSAHKGSISVQSELGKGATFIVKLPVFDPRAGNAGTIS